MPNTGTFTGQSSKNIAYGLLVIVVFITIQFGYSVYVAVPFFTFLVLFPLLLFGLMGNLKKVALPLLIGVLSFYISTTSFINSSDASQDILWCTRQCVCFICIIAAGYVSLSRIPKLPKFAFWALVLVIGALTLAQWAYLNSYISQNTLVAKHYFYNPELTSDEDSTVMEDRADLAIWNGETFGFRPQAFYSEPSYLGFICLCLYIFKHRPAAIKHNFIAFIPLLFLCLVAQTASGIIILCFFFFAANFGEIAFNKRLYPLFAIACAAIVYFSLPYISRVMAVTDSVSEFSGYTRLVFPLKCVGSVFAHAPLGVPFAEFPDFLRAYLPEDGTLQRGENFDNGIACIFMFFGLFGFIIWACLIGLARDRVLSLFVILSALNSGNLFSYDKAVLISITILVYTANNGVIKSRPNHRRNAGTNQSAFPNIYENAKA